MSAELVELLRWPLIAAFAICALIGAVVAFRFPMFAGARLDAAEALVEAQTAALAELRSRVGALEAGHVFDSQNIVAQLRGGGR